MKHLLLFFTLLTMSTLGATNADTTLMTIGDREISLEEFKYLYNKNNQVSDSDENSMEDYVDLFVNFKLKVIEAEDLGMDTISSFVKELGGYEAQLAEPYLKDQDLNEQLIVEAYNRLKEEVEASHILVEINSKHPNDTLRAYNEAMSIRQEILDGKDFAIAAKEYSTDPSAAKNGGNLGYFTGFQMVLPFEEAAFNTPVGEISLPVRSKFGYHIIKVNNRRPASGEVSVSHILILANEGMSKAEAQEKETQANSIYKNIQEGASFDKLASEYSEDKGSASKGGSIGFIRRGQTIPPFENAAFNLTEKGQIAPPVLTRFGWHIIRLDDKRGIPTYENKKADIKRRLARDERGDKPEVIFLNKLKKEYNYTINEENRDALYTAIKGQKVDSTFLVKLSEMNEPILSFGEKTVTQYEYAQYCAKKTSDGTDFASKWKVFEKETLMAYEKTQLSRKYPDYKNLTKEYHDGLLLFEISNEKVWGKASSDEKGLTKFYKKNKKNYLFEEATYEGQIIYLKDSSAYTSYIAMKETLDNEAISDSLTAEVMKVETGFYTKGDNKNVDAQVYGTEAYENANYAVTLVTGTLLEEGSIKPLKATRGACISDYQEYLEAKWIKSLRKTYKVKVNKAILAELE